MTMEITINNIVYSFRFGMGFLREVNRLIKQPIDGVKNFEKNAGLRYMIAFVIDGDIEALVDVLDAANKGFDPRVTRAQLEAYIEDENTDIDALFAQVLDFFKSANVTKKVTADILAAVEAERAKQANS